MKKLLVLTTLVVLFCSASKIRAATLYFKNGDEFEYQRYWERNGRIHVQINKESEVDFAKDELDLIKSKIAVKPAKTILHTADNIRPPSASDTLPHGYRTPTTQTKFSTLQEELSSIYGNFYTAMRSGNFNTLLKYVTGKQRKTTEKLINAPESQKTLFRQMITNLPADYTVTGFSAAPGGKKATLVTRRKMLTGVYDVNGVKTHEETSYISNTVEFIKQNNEWKIALAQDSLQ